MAIDYKDIPPVRPEEVDVVANLCECADTEGNAFVSLSDGQAEDGIVESIVGKCLAGLCYFIDREGGFFFKELQLVENTIDRKVIGRPLHRLSDAPGGACALENTRGFKAPTMQLDTIGINQSTTDLPREAPGCWIDLFGPIIQVGDQTEEGNIQREQENCEFETHVFSGGG